MYEVLRVLKFTETERRKAVARGWWGGGNWGFFSEWMRNSGGWLYNNVDVQT